jgi:hypothetical protein
MKSRNMKRVGHIACMEEVKNITAYGRIILK